MSNQSQLQPAAVPPSRFAWNDGELEPSSEGEDTQAEVEKVLAATEPKQPKIVPIRYTVQFGKRITN